MIEPSELKIDSWVLYDHDGILEAWQITAILQDGVRFKNFYYSVPFDKIFGLMVSYTGFLDKLGFEDMSGGYGLEYKKGDITIYPKTDTRYIHEIQNLIK